MIAADSLQSSSQPDALGRDEMNVDLFAGGGGASTAIKLATGRHPDVAVNHDPNAVALHAANHPGTTHYCCDVFEVDPVQACSDAHGNLRPVGLLWASPDCTHHSKARGGKPADKKIRALAWVVVKWASKVKPRCIFLENVEEFQDWGPLGEDNRPIKERRGEIFRTWVSQLEALGYAVEWRELVAADYGAPTTRKRLFLVARRDGRPIVWPEKTHASRAKLKAPSLFDAPMKPWRAAAEIIDWNLPCPSIFGRKKALAPKTQKRIAKGIKKFVIEAKSPFIVPVTHAGERPNHDVAEPFKTITAANRGELGVVAPTLTPRYGERDGQQPRTLDVAQPYPTVVPNGNGGDLTSSFLTRVDMSSAETAGVRDAQDPLATVLAAGGIAEVEVALGGAVVGCGGRAGQSPARGVGDPVGTVTAKADRCLAAAHITKFRAESTGADAVEPLPTVTANSYVKRPGCGVPLAPVLAHITKFSENSVGTDPSDPLHTAMAGAPRHGLVTAHLGRQFGTAVGRDMAEPHPTVMTDGAGGKSYVATACLTSYYGTGDGGRIDAPMPTVVTKDRHAPVAAFMEQANTGVVGHEASAPVSTILAAGSHQRSVQLSLEALEGEPGSRRAEVLAFLREHFGDPTDAERADPLATAQARLRFGLVIVPNAEGVGEVWQIADIGMRMLTPRELYGAQGFPADYVIDRTADGRPLTKTAQTRMAGNSVSPPPAAALIAANDPLLSRRLQAAA